jgi:hypothetical protein
MAEGNKKETKTTAEKPKKKLSPASDSLKEFEAWCKETKAVINDTLKQFSDSPQSISERQAVLAIKRQFQKAGKWQA